jgi:glycosyltransferase involved in cell wall biosynthesis
MLTVSIPTYNVRPKLLRHAIRSALQLDDMRVVVVNDGGHHPDLPSDRRIVYYPLPENHGRYFCDAVVVAALDGGWWAPHDADDLSLPDRWNLTGRFPRLSPYYRNDRLKTVNYPGVGWRQVGHWCAGVYPVEMAKGLVHPGYRVGWDTVFLLALEMVCPITVDDRPVYRYVRRPRSLTTSPQTGARSRYRAEQAERLRSLYSTLVEGDVAARIAKDVPTDVQEQVAYHAARLKALL